MPKFKTVNELLAHVSNKIADTLMDEVYLKVREIERKHIESDVYNVYTPDFYKRRKDNGGLISNENIVGRLVDKNTLSVTNETKSDRGNSWLPYWIEKGLIFSVEDYPWSIPRPFTHNTITELQSTKLHVKALQEGLSERGIKFR